MAMKLAYNWGWSKLLTKWGPILQVRERTPEKFPWAILHLQGWAQKPVTSRVLITPLIWSNFGDLTRPGPPNGGLVLTQIQTHPLVILAATLLSTEWFSKTCVAGEYIQQHVGLFDARTGCQAYNVNAAWAVWQSCCVAGEAHAEAITKVGLFSTEYGTFMVQLGQSDTDLRQQFGGDPQTITLCDRGFGITTWDPAVIMMIALTNAFTLRHVEGKQRNQGWWNIMIWPDFWPCRSYFTPLRNVSSGWGSPLSCCPNAPWDLPILIYWYHEFKPFMGS